MDLWRQRFILTPTVRRMEASHRQLGQAPPLQRALAHHGYSCCGCCGALTRQEVAGEVKDVAPVDGPLALQDRLANVIQPIDHHSILSGEENNGLFCQFVCKALLLFFTFLIPSEVIRLLLFFLNTKHFLNLSHHFHTLVID